MMKIETANKAIEALKSTGKLSPRLWAPLGEDGLVRVYTFKSEYLTVEPGKVIRCKRNMSWVHTFDVLDAAGIEWE